MFHWLKSFLWKYKSLISDLYGPCKSGSDTACIIVRLNCHLVRNLKSPRKWNIK